MTYSISKERAFNEMRKGYIAALLWSTTIFIGEGEEETAASGEGFDPGKGFIELCNKEVKTFF